MKISIITASYNCEKTISETIESILNQSYSDWELIVVDDGSKDGSRNIINRYCEQDSRIKLYTHDNIVNKGLKETLKLALTKTNCDYVQFVECDDILKPDSIEKKVEILKKYPDVALVFSEVELFGDKKAVEYCSDYMQKRLKVLENETFPSKIIAKSKHINVIPSFSSVMCKKSKLAECSFETPIDAYLDWFLWSQFANLDIYYIKEPLTKWRASETSYSREFEERYDRFKIGKYNLIIRLNIESKTGFMRKSAFFLFYLKYFISQIFSVTNSADKRHKIFTICGIKIKVKRNKN